MTTPIPTPEDKYVSVFSNTAPSTDTPPPAVQTSIQIGYIIALVSFVLIIIGCILAFIYRDRVISSIGRMTLPLYLGKRNEIHKTEFPENSLSKRVYEQLIPLDEIRAF
jgi:hypothetical protein